MYFLTIKRMLWKLLEDNLVFLKITYLVCRKSKSDLQIGFQASHARNRKYHGINDFIDHLDFPARLACSNCRLKTSGIFLIVL